MTGFEYAFLNVFTTSSSEMNPPVPPKTFGTPKDGPLVALFNSHPAGPITHPVGSLLECLNRYGAEGWIIPEGTQYATVPKWMGELVRKVDGVGACGGPYSSFYMRRELP